MKLQTRDAEVCNYSGGVFQLQNALYTDFSFAEKACINEPSIFLEYTGICLRRVWRWHSCARYMTISPKSNQSYSVTTSIHFQKARLERSNKTNDWSRLTKCKMKNSRDPHPILGFYFVFMSCLKTRLLVQMYYFSGSWLTIMIMHVWLIIVYEQWR